MPKTRILSSLAFVVVACGAGACGGNDPPPPPSDPYTSAPATTVVVGDGKGGAVYGTPSGDGCIKLPSGECVKPQDKCGDGARADVVVDSSGKVVAIVCYPADEAPTPVDDDGDVALGKGNKAVVSIDGADDGVDVAGDVTSSGNNVTVYGQGAGVSVIGGSVDAEGNNFSMRGVTVKKDVTINGNNATLVLCAIEGNLTVHGNNTVVAECDVLGDLTVVGVNDTLVSNHVGGTITVSDAKNLVCDGNTKWSDGNANAIVDPGEEGAAVTCETAK